MGATTEKRAKAESSWHTMFLEPVNESDILDLNSPTPDPTAHITAWYRANPVEDKMIYKEAAGDQLCFIRDTLFRSMFRENLKEANVISTHTSKSIKLAVYHALLIDGTEFIIRGNFYDYKLTVRSSKPLDLPADLMSRSFVRDGAACINPVYCEGFQEDWVLPFYTKTHNQSFTIEIGDRYEFYTLIYMIRQQLGLVPKQ